MSVQPHDEITQMTFQGNNRLTLGIVLGVLTFWLFAQSMVNVVPAVQADTAIPLDSLNLAIGLTALFSGCFIVVAGGIADKTGRVRMTLVGFTLSIIGSLCLIFAESFPLFATGRIMQGLSGACIMPATLSLVKTCYQGEARQRALSFWAIGSWGGSGICSLAGGAIATWMNWRWIFIFSILCSLLGMLLVRGTPESKVAQRQLQPFDYGGLLTFVITLISLNLIVTKGSRLGWLSMETLALGGVMLLSLTAFILIEIRKKSHGFIDFSLFRNRVWSGAVCSNLMLNSVAGTLLIASIYVQQGRGLSAFESGMLTIGYLVAVLSMIRVGEKLLQKRGARKPMLWGTTTTGFGIAIMTLTFLPTGIYASFVLLGYVLFGLGLGFYATPSTDTAISSSPASKIGIASAIYKMASSLGGAFGIAISASVYAALLPFGHSTAATGSLLVNVAFCAVSFAVVLLLVPAEAGKQA